MSSMKWINGGAKRQCDQAVDIPQLLRRWCLSSRGVLVLEGVDEACLGPTKPQIECSSCHFAAPPGRFTPYFLTDPAALFLERDSEIPAGPGPPPPTRPAGPRSGAPARRCGGKRRSSPSRGRPGSPTPMGYISITISGPDGYYARKSC